MSGGRGYEGGRTRMVSLMVVLYYSLHGGSYCV